MQSSGSILRRPRAKVTANGTAIRWERLEVLLCNSQIVSQFTVSTPLFDPMAPFDLKWWASTAKIEIEVSVGFADDHETVGQYTSLIKGEVELIGEEMIPEGYRFAARQGGGRAARGPMLQFSGSGYASKLINSPFSQEFMGTGGNLTSLQILQQIIAKHPQLTLDGSSLGGNVGSVYNQDAGRLVLHRSEWDTIQAIAAFENWKVRMNGTTLVVQPASAVDTQQNYRIFYNPASASDNRGPQSNLTLLRCARRNALAQGVMATVASQNPATGNDPNVGEASTGEGDTPGVAHTENVTGLSQDQANQAAQSRVTQVASWEREIEFALPGDPTLSLDSVVELTGTGTAFDQTYYPDQIRHILGAETGYTMEAIARSASAAVGVNQPATPTPPDQQPADEPNAPP